MSDIPPPPPSGRAAVPPDDLPGLPVFAELVVDLVDAIPAGSVLSYGDVAELLERGGPRQVGQVMARYGALTSWWRVVLADGSLPPGHEAAALQRHRAEGTPWRGDRIDMRRARWAGPAGSVSVVAD